MVFINPKIIKKSGAMNSYEGCLSFPQAYTNVKRYSHIIVKAQNLEGRYFTVEADGDKLLTKALQHEFDHLNGVLFVDHINKENPFYVPSNSSPVVFKGEEEE